MVVIIMDIVFKDVSYIHNVNTPLEKTILDGINCEIKSNKITGIIGPTGAGKTTMIELITALTIPSKGCIEVGKFRIEKNKKMDNINKLRSKIGLMFQFPEEQFFQPTVKKELEFGMKYFDYKVSEIDKRINQALKMVGLDESYLERNPFDLSSGEKRKVALASILVFNPKIIILDEPTVGLDSKNKKRLIKLVRNLRLNYNKTIIIVSHDIDMLYIISDNIIAINQGKIVCYGSKKDVFKEINLLRDNNINIPRVAEFSNLVLEKLNIDLGNYYEVNDIIKAIYRNV
jgi:energy-coupling factor transport system ATP-binding protein